MCLSQAKSVLGLGVDSAQNGPSQRRQTATAEAAFPVLTSGCLYQGLNDRESGRAVGPSSPSPEFPRTPAWAPPADYRCQVPAYERNHPGRPRVGHLHGSPSARGDEMVSARPSASVVRGWCRLTPALSKATMGTRGQSGWQSQRWKRHGAPSSNRARMRRLCPTASLRAHLKMGMKDVASFEHDGVAHAVLAFGAPRRA
jgi:hypothetical protein